MSAAEAPGVIEPGRLYVASEARQRLRIGRLGWKRLREAGLPVVYQGRQAYVFGDDLLRLFHAQVEGSK